MGSVRKAVSVMEFRSRHGDVVAAIGTLGFSVFLFAVTTRMSSRITTYPRLLASILAVAGVLLLIHALRRHGSGDPVFSDVAWKPMLAAALIWLTAIFATTLFGFFPVIAVMLAALVWVLESTPRSLPTLGRAVLFGGITSVVLWVVFYRLLGVVTPEGALF